MMGTLLTLNLEAILAAVGLTWVITMFIAVILAFIAVFTYLVPSAGDLAEWRPDEFSTPSKLMKIGYIGGLALVVIAVLSLIVAVPAEATLIVLGAIGLVILGGVLALIGWIGNIIYLFKLNGVFKETLFLVAAILLIISIFIAGVLAFIAWILIYVGAGSVEKKIVSGEIQI